MDIREIQELLGHKNIDTTAFPIINVLSVARLSREVMVSVKFEKPKKVPKSKI